MQVDLLRRKLKGNAGIYVAMAADLVSILFCLYLAKLSFAQMQGMYKLHRTATSFNMPIWIAYLAVPSGACLMAIRLIQNLISTAKTLKAGKES